MRHFVRFAAAAAVLVAGSTLSAQQPMPGGAPQGRGPVGMGPMAGATFLLAHTGDLQLTDPQVVRLAGIARRESARRKALMTTVDSVRRSGAGMRRDSAGPRRPDPQMMTRLTQARGQVQTDLRDAIAVLTPDQQAQAWTMMARGATLRRQGGMRERGRERGREREPGMRMREREGARGGMMGPRARGGMQPQPGRPGMAPRGRAGGPPVE